MEGGPCPVCLGKGEVLVRLPIRSCKRRSASGRAIPGDPFLIVKAGRKLCSLCCGTGWLFPKVEARRQQRDGHSVFSSSKTSLVEGSTAKWRMKRLIVSL